MMFPFRRRTRTDMDTLGQSVETVIEPTVFDAPLTAADAASFQRNIDEMATGGIITEPARLPSEDGCTLVAACPDCERRAVETAELHTLVQQAMDNPHRVIPLPIPSGHGSITAAHVVACEPWPNWTNVIAWLEQARTHYQPWARRHAHTLIDELIERAKSEGAQG